MIVCCCPAESSVASLTARREGGEHQLGPRSSSISPKNCEKPDAATEIRPQTYSSCAGKNPHLAVGHLIKLIFDPLQSLWRCRRRSTRARACTNMAAARKPHPPCYSYLSSSKGPLHRKHRQ